MNYRGVLFLLGRLQLALGGLLLIPACVGLQQGEGTAQAFFVSAAAAGISGLWMDRAFRTDVSAAWFGQREAMVLVTATWLIASIIGALPYILLKGPTFIVDGFFESASGFTTTGASILDNVESESAALLLWRSLTQWLGGMGMIVLGIAVLPKLAIGGTHLLGAEAPGPTAEKLTPRIAQTAKALWGTYALLTGLEFSALTALGMAPLEAINHSLTTMATGGFSTRNGSVGEFGSAIEIVILLFMVLAGINFAMHFNLLRGRAGPILKDMELRLYLGLIATAGILIAADLMFHGQAEDLGTALRLGAFQSATVITTTGYATADFDAWPHFSRALLFLLMFVGGCSGSTSGSVKIVRILIGFKRLHTTVRLNMQPSAVFPIRVGRRALPDEVVQQVVAFLLLFVVLFAAGGLLLTLLGLEPLTAFSASATCLGNIGPGFADIGPTHTMSQLPIVAKLFLVSLMIVGRLELYTVLMTLYYLRKAR